MSAKYQVNPLRLGRVTQVEKSGQLYLTEPGTHICAEMIVWLVRGPGIVALVDSGPGTPEMVMQKFGRTLEQSLDETPAAALARFDLTPEDVDVIVQSHLHWDHSLGLVDGTFPNAEIYLQRAELQYALAPYPPHRRLYDPATLRTLAPTFDRELAKVRLLHGDFSLAGGLDVLLTPGHTPGIQTLMVETERGVIGIVSDNVPLDQGRSGLSYEDWIPPGVHVDLNEWYSSMAKVSALADFVVPAHDAIVFDETERFGLS